MNLLSKILLIKNYLLGRYSIKSYSQEGEDLILARIFEGKQKGIYVDVGAHHPLRFSNTYLLYRQGWSGINLDANPGSMDAFKMLRPRDLNLQLGIADKISRKTFYQFNEPAINTFDYSLIKNNLKVGYKLVGKQSISVLPLSTILHRYLQTKHIDLLSIDIEGFDYRALKSMDWTYSPTVVVIEQLGASFATLINSRSSKLLQNHGYHLHAKTVNSAIYLLD